MSNLSIFEKKWIDLVFEGKNQAYGAYKLRQENPKTTLLAFLFGLFFIFSICGAGLFLSSFTTKPVEQPPVVIDRTIYVTKVHTEPKKTVIPKAEPKTETPKSTAKIKKYVAVKPDEEDKHEPTKNPNTTPVENGTPQGTGTEKPTVNSENSGGNEIPKPTKEIVLAVALDEQPDFPGGVDKFRKYVGDNFKAPEIDASETTVISVIMSFVIEKDGTMSNIKVLRSSSSESDQEAIRVLKSLKTKWKAGKIAGEPVRTYYTLPIKVKIN